MMQTTKSVVLTERHLLLPIVWEGDLELHTNEEKMEQSIFGKTILHGDTILSIAIQLILENGVLGEIYAYSSQYKKSTSVGDEMLVIYNTRQMNSVEEIIEFEALNQYQDVILSGSLTVKRG